ncbi:MAG TPA: prephenate dehydratase [Vicinamibacterales bacterium]|nr:prephenate dehydratase [Vicinamibacterales bacterium]
MRIAYQGEPGAYSEAAALAFDPEATPFPCRSFEDVFQAVSDGTVARGILPMENTIGGTIHRNYDLLVEHELPIVGEVQLKVDHCLLALPGVRIDDVRVVHSHPQALAQCERFLRGLPNVQIEAVYDTAGGAKLIREQGLKHDAAIASIRAAQVFELNVLQRGIQDFDTNITRFCVIARQPITQGADKTSIVFALPSEPGSLFRALSAFALRGIDLTKLESRPIRGRAWEYMFYADLAVSRDDLNCARALVNLAEFARWVRTLGTYRASREVSEPAEIGHSTSTESGR